MEFSSSDLGSRHPPRWELEGALAGAGAELAAAAQEQAGAAREQAAAERGWRRRRGSGRWRRWRERALAAARERALAGAAERALAVERAPAAARERALAVARERAAGRVLFPRPKRAPGAGPVGPHDMSPRPGLGYEAQEVPRQAQRRAFRP